MEQPRVEPFDFEGPGPRSTRLTALILGVLILGVVTFVLVTALHAMASRAGVAAYGAPRLFGPGASFRQGDSTWMVQSGHWVVRGTEVRIPAGGEGRVDPGASPGRLEAAVEFLEDEAAFRLAIPASGGTQYWLSLSGDGRFTVRLGDLVAGEVLFSGAAAPTEAGRIALSVYRNEDLLHVRVGTAERVIPGHLTLAPLLVDVQGGEVRIHQWSFTKEEEE